MDLCERTSENAAAITCHALDLRRYNAIFDGLGKRKPNNDVTCTSHVVPALVGVAAVLPGVGCEGDSCRVWKVVVFDKTIRPQMDFALIRTVKVDLYNGVG